MIDDDCFSTATPCWVTVCGSSDSRLAHAILDVDLVDVGVAARLEHDVDGDVAGRAAGRREIQQVVDAIELSLDRRRDLVGDHLRRRPRVRGPDAHRGRRHLRVLLDRRVRHRHQAGQDEQDRNDRRQDWPVDEEMREHATRPSAGPTSWRRVRSRPVVAGARRGRRS